MIIPTLFLSIKIAYSSRKDFADFIHNVAICFWIAANCTWMTGEFFYHDNTRPYAQIFFFIGLGIIGAFYLWEASKWLGYNIAKLMDKFDCG